MRSYVPSSYRGHRARVAIAAAQDGQGETSKPLPLCGLPGVPTSAARSHRRPPTDKERPLNSPNPPRSLVSRSLVALVSPTGRHSGFQTVPRKGSTDEKRGGGGHAQRRYFFFRRTPFVNAFVVRSRHSSYFITFYRRRGTAVRALFFVAGSHVMRTPTLGQNHDRYAPPCRSVTSTSLLASLLASSCLIFFM